MIAAAATISDFGGSLSTPPQGSAFTLAQIMLQESGVPIPLENFAGDKDFIYPLGIASPTSKTLLGVASNDTDAFNLFKDDPEVTALGTLTGVVNRICYFEPLDPLVIVKFYGLEFFTFRSSYNSILVHTDNTTIIRVGATNTLGSSGTMVASNTIAGYNGAGGLLVPPPFNVWTVPLTPGAGTPVQIFHSRTAKVVGMAHAASIYEISGILPLAMESFMFNSIIGVDYNQVSNWQHLAPKYLQFACINGVPHGLNDFDLLPLNTVQTHNIKGLLLRDIQFSESAKIAANVTATNYPVISLLNIFYNGQDALGGLYHAGFFDNMPFVDQHLRTFNNGPNTTPANADAALIALAARLISVVPSGIKTLQLNKASSRTSASDAAVAQLQAAGWILNLV